MSVNLLCFATAYGFNGAVDAYAPQAFGSGRTTELWMILYRQAVFLLALVAVVACVVARAEDLLLAVGQRSEVAHDGVSF